MDADPFMGVVLHAVGGLAAASFYIPYKRVRGWSWETYWLAGGFFSWIIAPWALALFIVPSTPGVLQAAAARDLFWTWFFGVMWGVGGLMFGLTMRFLGISLGYAIALGFCAAFGTLIPPLYSGEIRGIAASAAGQFVLLGVGVCLAGIGVGGLAGMSKERELTDEQKKASVGEFSFVKGMIVAVICGILSASMSYAFTAGKPIAELAIRHGAPPLWQNLPVLVVILAGGFTTNFVWCALMNLKNRSGKQYLGRAADGTSVPMRRNYVFCAAAGVLWYFQFFFYSMGTTKMGPFDFSSWTLHMASIIIFSTLWGILLREWRGTSARTRRLMALGLATLIVSTLVVGYGNYLKVQKPGKSTGALRRE
jgi:L-rhamnose-H+ transport protein